MFFPRSQLTRDRYWFRWWLGAEEATRHCLNQWWHSSLAHLSLGFDELTVLRKLNSWLPMSSRDFTRTDPRPAVRPAEGPNSFHWKKVGSFILLHKISRTACCFGIRTFLKQYNWHESATNLYTDHQNLAQYSDIINNLQKIPLIFCNYAVRSCGTWRKGPGQSPCNGLSISDLELYVTETSTGVCDPVTD